MKEAVFGPAIIEDAWSTVVIPPGWQARPDAIGQSLSDEGDAMKSRSVYR